MLFRSTCVVRRSTTNTPLQALTTENEPAFLEACRTMAQRLLSQKGDDDAHLRMAYELTMARAPKLGEITLLNKALAYYRKKYLAAPNEAKKLIMVGESPQAKNLSAPDQAAWMIICSTLMNTDEFLTIH